MVKSTLTVTLDPKHFDKLDEIAKRQFTSRSSIVRQLIDEVELIKKENINKEVQQNEWQPEID